MRLASTPQIADAHDSSDLRISACHLRHLRSILTFAKIVLDLRRCQPVETVDPLVDLRFLLGDVGGWKSIEYARQSIVYVSRD
jgi:hypothetical protein